jgi:hypothetical protein
MFRPIAAARLIPLNAAPRRGQSAPLVPPLCQVPGLLADRWFFFAQAKHPQNLHYQVVS